MVILSNKKMILELPLDLQKLILSYLTRKEYRATVPCKALLLCESYLNLNAFAKLNKLPIIQLSSSEKIHFFLESCKLGHWRVVRFLLKDPNDKHLKRLVDPSADNNIAIRLASTEGHKEVVEILLEDPRVDPSDINNITIRYASESDHKEVVEMLLKDLRVDPSADNNYAIRWASINGHKEVVEILLKDPSSASAERRVALRPDSRVDPSADNNWAKRWASLKGHKEIVEMLSKAELNQRL